MQLTKLATMFERRGEYGFANLLNEIIDDTETRNYSNVEQFESAAIARTDNATLENNAV